MSFKPMGLDERLWNKLLSYVNELSSREKVGHDICLIGSYARGQASSISDVDLIMFAKGEPNLRATELFYINGKEVTIFPVNVCKLLEVESIDFYKANSAFEAKLIHGSGNVLNMLRNGIFGKRLDLSSTKKIMGRKLALRLMSTLSDAILDYGEGIRNMRICIAESKLYVKLFKEGVDPWSIIPYSYKPDDELERLLDELYYSKDYDDLLLKLMRIDLKDLVMRTFEERLRTMAKVIEGIMNEFGFAGEHVGNYAFLYLIVEEKVRATIWSKLPGRWRVEEELGPNVNHERTNISCWDGVVSWLVSIGGGEGLKIERYGTIEF